ncbi:MAG: carbamoyltransferase N-terminal domain-containing protein, partial [Bdellovibrionota bacterium]
MYYLGIGKTLYQSSACLINKDEVTETELLLTERLSRKKASGAWPETALEQIASKLPGSEMIIAESSDVFSPKEKEQRLEDKVPFLDRLKHKGLSRYSTLLNPQIQFVPHHLCHATAAIALSPFTKCVVVVMDGAGTKKSDFPQLHSERDTPTQINGISSQLDPNCPRVYEECSVYLFDEGTLRCVLKRWSEFKKGRIQPRQYWNSGIGISYEKCAEYIFNCNRSAGKVMGLAPFGKSKPVKDRIAYLDQLDWNQAFNGHGKSAWENSGRFLRFADIAASIQSEFEIDQEGLFSAIREAFPDYSYLIFTGGCALNCTGNGKMMKRSLFDRIYIPPFPGDESIGFGAAHHLYFNDQPSAWRPVPHENQRPYFGPISSIPNDPLIESIFSSFVVDRPA